MKYKAVLLAAIALNALVCAAARAQEPFEATRQFASWVTGTRDHKGLPFAIVDKQQARLYVYHGNGQLAGTTAALVGATPGDHIVPGVGQRAQVGAVRADERTTPAGRFVSQPGLNLSGERVVWVDYESAFAIHRLRPGHSYKMRAARLASETPGDNRVSLGCVIVPVAFYKQVVDRVLGRGKSIVYVLPETRPVADMFGAAL